MYKIQDIINKIIPGDSLDKLKLVPDKSVDMIFADPPYFMQTDGILRRTNGTKFNGVEDAWDKFSGFEEYDEFCYSWLRECKRILKNDGTIWVIGSFQNIYRLGYIMQNLGFWILNDVIWAKPNAVPNFGGTRFQNSHETLLWCNKGKNHGYTFNYKTMKHLNNDKQDKSIWNISICIGNERLKDTSGKKLHSTQKPEQLLYKVILASTKPNDIILDPFFGTGTTGAVAKLLGRNYIGIEKEFRYSSEARKRIDNVIPEINDITQLELEVKPPKVPMENLISANLLTVNEYLYNYEGKRICRLCEDGKVSDNTDILSIHKMSAKKLNRANNNGWEYFYIKRDNKLIPLNNLRYLYKELYKNGTNTNC
jgi:site-specific DNA-methyltransferase (adenine-specific)